MSKPKWQEAIDFVLSGEKEDIPLVGDYWASPDDIVNYIESLEYERKDFDTNGWEIDFWITFTNTALGDKKIQHKYTMGNLEKIYTDTYYPFQLYGSWYYGKQTFERCKEYFEENK